MCGIPLIVFRNLEFPMNTLLSASLILVASAVGASAAVLHSDNVGTFNADAAGLTLSTIDFNDGIENGTQDGSTYSPFVVFSSGMSATYGGFDSPDVSDSFFEIGPVSGFDGLLIMQFAFDIVAVAFETYLFNAPETVTLYDDGVEVFSAASKAGAASPAFQGLVASGLVFDKVVLDGAFFSLDSLTYAAANGTPPPPPPPIPLPAGIPLLATGLLGLGLVTRTRRKG